MIMQHCGLLASNIRAAGDVVANSKDHQERSSDNERCGDGSSIRSSDPGPRRGGKALDIMSTGAGGIVKHATSIEAFYRRP